MAEEKTEIAARNKALVAAGFDAWTTGQGSPFELLAVDATWTIVGHSVVAKTYHGREAFMTEVIRPFNARMREGLKPVVHQILADGDRVAILFDASAVRIDGRSYTNSYAWFFQMRDGKVVEATAYFDSIAFDALWREVRPAPSTVSPG